MTFSSKTFLAAIATAYLSCFGSAFSSSAATANVSVVNNAFLPASTNIAIGDQITWTWPSGSFNHNTVSSGGVWTSPVNSGPATFSHTFTSAGSFPYSCTIHGFTGTINVSTPNVPPTISITNPVSGTIFIAPANLTVQASASDSDGTVTNVQFRIGSTVLTNKAAAPFSAVTNNLPAGSYTLSAIASDNNGVKSTNAVAISVVTPLPLAINAPQLSSASFQFSFAANIGLSYVVQWSTNLTSPNWIPIFTSTAASNPVVFVDNHATNSPGFYRVGRLPNP
jgi:plastocyanin